MHPIVFSLIILLLAIGITSIITIAASVISRKYRINYSYFAQISIVLYVTTAWLVYERSDDKLLTITVLLLLGFYDGTAGWHISKKLKAWHGKYQDLTNTATNHEAIIASLIYAFLMAWVGIFIAA